jgi:hypothetical protein
MHDVTKIFRCYVLLRSVGIYQTLDKKASVRRDGSESVESDRDFDAKWEILGENLVLGNVIGQGAFGIVRKGVLQEGDNWRDVAVKMLRGDYKHI